MFCLQTTKRINLKPLFSSSFMMMFCVCDDHTPGRLQNWIHPRYILSFLALHCVNASIAIVQSKEKSWCIVLHTHTHTWFFFHHMSRQAHKTLFLLLQLSRFSFFIIHYTHTHWLVHLKSNNDSVYFLFCSFMIFLSVHSGV